jgi:hypothetical protein
MKVLSLIFVVFLTLAPSPGSTFGQERLVSQGDLNRLIMDGTIAHADFKGIPYRFTQSSNREKIIVESGGNTTYRAVHSGPGGRAPIWESILIGDRIYERKEDGPWTTQTLAEYRRYQAATTAEWEAARSIPDATGKATAQPLMNPATSLVVAKMFISLNTLFLNSAQDAVISNLGNKATNGVEVKVYRSTGSHKFDSPADKNLLESRFDNLLEFNASSGMLVEGRHKIDWIYTTKTVTYITLFKWELDPRITIVPPI